MSYKSIDGLMRHLRSNGVAINGSAQKRKLRNTGYFHGYKGYRFFKSSSNPLPFTSFDEVYATIQYDSDLKALLYGKMMFLETAIKNIALECILDYTKSESIQEMLSKAVSSYNNCPPSFTTAQRREAQQNKLVLEGRIHNSLSRAYKNKNPKITHFYNNGYGGVPIWALFEIMTLGEFGRLFSCLNYDMRDQITKKLGINLSADTERQLVANYLYALKDLRNAIAHNSTVFDTRFLNFDPTKSMKMCLKQEIGLPYVNFKTIGDFIILIAYLLKLLGTSKTEIKSFIRDFEKITDDYTQKVNPSVSKIVIHADLKSRMDALKKYI